MAAPSRAAEPELRSIPETLLFTAGTTHRDANGRDHAYLFWQTPATDLMSGKAFAIYSKAGTAESPAPFTQESVVQSSLDEKLAAIQLSRAEWIGQNLDELDEVLGNVWQALHLLPSADLAAMHENGVPLPEPPALPTGRALKTVTVLQALFADPAQLDTTRTLAASQPALALVLGCAWVGPMPVETRTYELREWNAQTSTDGAVIGRVTLTAGAPVLLPAPGQPLQVPDLTENGDLRINLRWATPDPLRRRLFLHQGYEVWRMPWATATANGFDAAPPTLEQLITHATRVSGGVLYASKLFDETSVADFTADAESRHFSDDNNRFANPAAPTPFADGAEFGYVVTARDLLGRPGLPSTAGYGRACRTIAPRQPLAVEARVTYGEADAETGIKPQSFTVTWEQNPDLAPDLPSVSHYEIFRTDERFVFPIGDPLVGQLDLTKKLDVEIPRTPELTALSFTDPAIAANPELFLGKTIQYAVRAVFLGACHTLYSPLSAPANASLEDNREAPEPQTISAPLGDCPLVAIMASDALPVGENAAQPGFHFRLRLTRRDPGIASVRFTQSSNDEVKDLGEVHFGDDEDNIAFTDVELTPEEVLDFTTTFTVQAIGFDGTTSRPIDIVRRPTPNLDPSQIITAYDFLAGVLSTGTLSESDPLAHHYINSEAGLVFFTDLALEKRTTQIAALPSSDPGERCLISRFSDGAWIEIGTGVNYNGMVYFDDPTIPRPEAGEDPVVAPAPTEYRARPLFNLPYCSDGAHLAQSGDGRPSPISLMMVAHPDAREYRFFRRVDDGELELIAQGARPQSLALIRRQDPGVPPGAEVVTYYGQFMAKNGIASTLRVLGVIRPHHIPPTPVLNVPRAIGDSTAPAVRLTWSCPPEHVQRFELFLDTSRSTVKYSIAHPAVLSLVTPVNYEPPPAIKPAVWRIRKVGSASKTIVRREGLLTARVGSAVPGAGPQFSIDLPITPNTRYSVSVRAVGRSGSGSGSRTYDFTWRTPPAPLEDKPLPWPFRHLPSVVDEPAAIAAGLQAENLPLDGEVPALRWPATNTGPHVGFRIGRIVPRTSEFAELNDLLAETVPHAPVGLYFLPGDELPSSDFNTYLRRIPNSELLTLPAVLYRQQLPSEDWPTVSGDVIQVSPLVSRIVSELRPNFRDDAIYNDPFLRDPYIAVTTDSEQGSSWFGDASLYLLDTTPRVAGARYRYWLVCFGADTGAPEAVIPSTLEPRAN